ncbi:hypothetical protein TD95_000973 [Thielaviopsis punctulata]|uniref:PH domain-containing protein n=1 Tax=Thielaviopsis punctulata TaxID=72032 RepID=A0A0F4ZC72_9PEZI|nr:hypothetical protein TD95_000973 [Thielaviopsis punctulata]
MAAVASNVAIPRSSGSRDSHSHSLPHPHSPVHRQFSRHSYSRGSTSSGPKSAGSTPNATSLPSPIPTATVATSAATATATASANPNATANSNSNSNSNANANANANAGASSRARDRLMLDHSPVDQNGSFEFDRIVKSGYVQKRTQKTKTWKSVFLVLRPTSLSIYKTESENKLRHKIELSDVTAVAHLKDPKHKREHVFGLFSASRNYHLQAPSEADVNDWVSLIRTHARIEEEEEEMFLQSPQSHRPGAALMDRVMNMRRAKDAARADRMLSSSPELQVNPPTPRVHSPSMSMVMDYSGLSGNEMASDFSDTEMPRLFVPSACASSENVVGPISEHAVLDTSGTNPRPSVGAATTATAATAATTATTATSPVSTPTQPDPDRVIWQNWLWMQRSKGGVRQWRNYWAVLRPRNLILYRDQSEYTAQFILPLGSIVDAVDIDPISKTKKFCLQVITEEKTFKFCAHDEEALVQCLGAFKSLLAKRRELEARASASAAIGASAAAPAGATASRDQ